MKISFPGFTVVRSCLLTAWLGLALGLGASGSARAATYTWDGGLSRLPTFPTNANWSTATNWQGGVAPVASVDTDLIFATSYLTGANQNIVNPFTLHSLAFTANFTTLTGNALNFVRNTVGTEAALTQNSITAVTINNALRFDYTLILGGTDSGSVTLAGPLSGPGGLLVNATNAFILNGASTYTGPTSVSAGTLVLNNGNDAPVAVNGTAANLQVQVGTKVAGAIGADSSGNSTPGNGGVGVTLSGGTLTNGGTVAGGNGGGTLNMGGTGGSGAVGVTMNGGALINSGAVAGGSGGYGPTGGGGGSVGVSSSGGSTLTNGGAITGGSGGSALNGSANNGGSGGNGAAGVIFAGGTLTNGGTVAGGNGGNGGGGLIGGSGGNGAAGATLSGGATLTNSGAITGGNGGSSAGGSGGGGGGNGSGGNGGNGAAGVTLSGGSTLINGGTVAGGSGYPGAVGSNGGTNGTNGTNGAGVTSGGGAVALVNQRGGSITSGVVLGNAANNVTLQIGSSISGGLNVGTSASSTLTLTDDGNGGSQAYSAAVGGGTTFAGSLVKSGVGTWTLDQALGYTGTTTINGGALRQGISGAFGASPTVVLNTVVPAVLDLNGFDTVLGSLSGGATSGRVVLGAGTLTVGGNNTSTGFAGIISGGGGLIKVGTGTLALTGGNTYTGDTVVRGGALSVGDPAVLGAAGSAVYLLNGAALLVTAPSVTTSRTYYLGTSMLGPSGGGSITYQGATVNGGTLGFGNQILRGNTTLNGVRTTTGTVLSQSGGTVAWNNVTLGGNSTFTQATGTTLNSAGEFITTPNSTMTIGGTFNTAGGSVSGALTINAGGAVNQSGAAPLYLDGSRGTTISAGSSNTPPGQLNAQGSSTVELGGLLVNNGVQTGTLHVNLGGVARGTGTFGTVNVADSGRFGVSALATDGSANIVASFPGTDRAWLMTTKEALMGPVLSVVPGSAKVTSLALGSGSIFALTVKDAQGPAGVGYDSVGVTDALSLNGGTTPGTLITISLGSLNGSGVAGAAANFDPARNYTFILVSAAGGITGYNANEFAVDLGGFQNNTNGGRFSVVQDGNNLDLVFSAVPEPSTGVLLATGAVWVGVSLRRRKRS